MTGQGEGNYEFVLRGDKPEQTKQKEVSHGVTDSVTACGNHAWKSLTPKRKMQIFAKSSACQFKDHKTQKICGSRFQLEIDHIQPKWAGGLNYSQNLQVLCRAHNQFRYHSETRHQLANSPSSG